MHLQSGDGEGGDIHPDTLLPLPANASGTSIQSDLADDAEIRQNNMLIEKVKSVVRDFVGRFFGHALISVHR
jgi:hypothetical protein